LNGKSMELRKERFEKRKKKKRIGRRKVIDSKT
jgi:hypothetical protein